MARCRRVGSPPVHRPAAGAKGEMWRAGREPPPAGPEQPKMHRRPKAGAMSGTASVIVILEVNFIVILEVIFGGKKLVGTP